MLPTSAVCEMSSQEVITKFNKIRLLIRASLKRLFPELQFTFTFFRDTQRGQYDIPATTGTAFRATRVECAALVYEYAPPSARRAKIRAQHTSRLPLGGSYSAAEFITYEDEHELLLMVNKVVFLYSTELIRIICQAWKPKQLLDKTPIYMNPRYKNNMLYFTEEDKDIFITINIYTKYKAAVLSSFYSGWRLPNTISPSKYRDTPVIVSAGLPMGPYSRVTQRINCEPLFLHKLKSRLVNHINYYVPNRLSDEMYEGGRTASIATHLRKKYSERNIDNLWDMFVVKYSHLLDKYSHLLE